MNKDCKKQSNKAKRKTFVKEYYDREGLRKTNEYRRGYKLKFIERMFGKKYESDEIDEII